MFSSSSAIPCRIGNWPLAYRIQLLAASHIHRSAINILFWCLFSCNWIVIETGAFAGSISSILPLK